MNIIAIWLILVGTKSGLIVMCKILMVVITFLFMRTLILLYLAAQLTTVSLDLEMKYVYIHYRV